MKAVVWDNVRLRGRMLSWTDDATGSKRQGSSDEQSSRAANSSWSNREERFCFKMSAAAGGTTQFDELPGITLTCTEHSLLASGGNFFLNE